MKIKRYPPTTNRSLTQWNAGEEYLLKEFNAHFQDSKIAIFNDKFGYLTCNLHNLKPQVFIEQKSQQKAILQNLNINDIPLENIQWIMPVGDEIKPIDVALISIPKSVELFEYYLKLIMPAVDENSVVLCSFMTKHFTPQLIEVGEKYFEVSEQSLAWKKSRVLKLKQPRQTISEGSNNLIEFTDELLNGSTIKHYPGVFSSGGIDLGTRLLLENLKLKENEHKILDLGSGNGVIGAFLQNQKNSIELHLIDDSWLAIESSKMNVKGDNTFFHWNDTLTGFQREYFDLIVTNPPFHLGHELNIEITLNLFKETANILKPGGRFLVVSNKHLNYSTHLKKSFSNVNITHQTEKFEIIECLK